MLEASRKESQRLVHAEWLCEVDVEEKQLTKAEYRALWSLAGAVVLRMTKPCAPATDELV